MGHGKRRGRNATFTNNPQNSDPPLGKANSLYPERNTWGLTNRGAARYGAPPKTCAIYDRAPIAPQPASATSAPTSLFRHEILVTCDFRRWCRSTVSSTEKKEKTRETV
jgi:hypothetical protein